MIEEQILLTSFGNDVCVSFGSQYSSLILILKVHRQKDSIPFFVKWNFLLSAFY